MRNATLKIIGQVLHIPVCAIMASLNNAWSTRVTDGIPDLEFKSVTYSLRHTEKSFHSPEERSLQWDGTAVWTQTAIPFNLFLSLY
jgi:hypothetical protein